MDYNCNCLNPTNISWNFSDFVTCVSWNLSSDLTIWQLSDLSSVFLGVRQLYFSASTGGLLGCSSRWQQGGRRHKDNLAGKLWPAAERSRRPNLFSAFQYFSDFVICISWKYNNLGGKCWQENHGTVSTFFLPFICILSHKNNNLIGWVIGHWSNNAIEKNRWKGNLKNCSLRHFLLCQFKEAAECNLT